MYSNVSDSDELPAIDKIDETVHENRPRFNIWFENGARLRYHVRNGDIIEDVFAPSDADSVMDSAYIGEGDESDAAEARDQAAEYYEHYETVGELKQDWTNLADWITHD